ncbi:hypothetical protein B0H14DRAFT_3895673 [Mycena olivaceomarginata]|nr:hypothetical protein B0H14DRAFT_3895673 [Mycena olivaceomarginata]
MLVCTIRLFVFSPHLTTASNSSRKPTQLPSSPLNKHPSRELIKPSKTVDLTLVSITGHGDPSWQAYGSILSWSSTDQLGGLYVMLALILVPVGPLHHTRLRRTFAFSASTTQTCSRSTRPPAGDTSDVKIASTFIKYVDYVTPFALMAASNTSHSGMRMLSLLITAEYSAWEWYSPSALPHTMTTTTSDQRELIAPGCE